MGARMQGLMAPAPRTKLYFKYRCADRRHQGCQPGDRDFGTSPIFGQLSDKPLLAEYPNIWGVGT